MNRTINTELIKEKVKELCLSANFKLNDEILLSFKNALKSESNNLSKNNLNILIENSEIAKGKKIALCQDTGLAFIFLEIGQDISLTGTDLNSAVNEGVKEAYSEGYLRKSVVSDPLNRKNTNTNCPAITHIEIVPGDKIRITILAKGGGAENMSRLIMLKPTQGKEEIKKLVIETVKEAGASACPPVVVGIGIGGSFDTAPLLAKKALLRNLNEHNKDKYYKDFEEEILNEINKLNIGTFGLGGKVTALAVHIETAPCHIASLPVAINLQCHSHRVKSCELRA